MIPSQPETALPQAVTDLIEQEAKEIIGEARHVISLVRCDSSHPAGLSTVKVREALRRIATRALEQGRAQTDSERVRLLEQAVGNCFMMARRQIAAHLNGTSTPEKNLERWQHVQRFCETTGSKSSILRGQLPSEITDGSWEQGRAQAPASPPGERPDQGALTDRQALTRKLWSVVDWFDAEESRFQKEQGVVPLALIGDASEKMLAAVDEYLDGLGSRPTPYTAQDRREHLLERAVEALRIGPGNCWCSTGEGVPHSATCMHVGELMAEVDYFASRPTDAPRPEETPVELECGCVLQDGGRICESHRAEIAMVREMAEAPGERTLEPEGHHDA